VNVLQLETSTSCIHAATRLTYCPYCRGLADVIGCHGYCLNVMRGCLATVSDVNDVWNRFVGAYETFKAAIYFTYTSLLILFGYKLVPGIF